MSKIKKSTLQWALKPFDIVTNLNGDVGYIQEVNVNDCQDSPKSQISYSIKWLVANNKDIFGNREKLEYFKTAWYDHDELELHGNLFVKMAETAVCSGSREKNVQLLFNNMRR